MHAHSVFALTRRYVDPATMLGETMFGLIMTLTFTLGAGLMLEEQGREGARQLLIALVGCNLAWGIIDAALYLLNQAFDRGRFNRMHTAIGSARDEASAERAVANELDDLLRDFSAPADRSAFYRRIIANLRVRSLAANRFTKADVQGSLVSFCLVFAASLPAAIPFLFIDHARLALRLSNGILIALLFATGYVFAQSTVARPWRVGLSLAGGGLVLVLIAIALGG